MQVIVFHIIFKFCKPSISPFTVACRSFCSAERLRSVAIKSKAPCSRAIASRGEVEKDYWLNWIAASTFI